MDRSQSISRNLVLFVFAMRRSGVRSSSAQEFFRRNPRSSAKPRKFKACGVFCFQIIPALALLLMTASKTASAGVAQIRGKVVVPYSTGLFSSTPDASSNAAALHASKLPASWSSGPMLTKRRSIRFWIRPRSLRDRAQGQGGSGSTLVFLFLAREATKAKAFDSRVA
jgi:hypothetical protein